MNTDGQRLNMYAVIWNEWVKDIVIAHNETEARELASDELHEIDASKQPVKLIDDTLQTMTNRGVMTVRQVIEHYGQSRYLTGIDNIHVQI